MSDNIQCGGAQSRRGFSSFEDYKIRKGITDNLSEAERMGRLGQLFRCFTAAATAASDNFQPGEFERRVAQDSSLLISLPSGSCMQNLLETAVHSLDLMRECRDEMGKSPLSQVNGTSVHFAACVQAYENAEIRVAAALETAERHGLLARASETVQAMKLKLARMVMPFLLLPEWLHSHALAVL